MAHLGARAFETIGGEVVQTTAFVIRNVHLGGNGVYFRLVDSKDKENDFVNNLSNGGVLFIANAIKFTKIPGCSIAYWLSNIFYELFNNKQLSVYADARIGMVSGDNDRFLRLWHEINWDKVSLGATDFIQAFSTGKNGFLYKKAEGNDIGTGILNM